MLIRHVYSFGLRIMDYSTKGSCYFKRIIFEDVYVIDEFCMFLYSCTQNSKYRVFE